MDNMDSVVLDRACSRCGERFLPSDEDPEVPGLMYCSKCGHPATYDR